ncbi:unnamed protein product [Mytilus coruscus]|uniref:Furin n=1 Tax=Mytilus coruscus TaxID=42192 RepID=A0A6J8CAC2_MYTCO|nr:unnamed protein product [Mytilus coruscus]
MIDKNSLFSIVATSKANIVLQQYYYGSVMEKSVFKSEKDYGINVLPAWKKCYNGSGIIVAVVDTGIESRNSDLTNKVNKDLSYTNRTMYNADHNLILQHGTETAGLIAAEANNISGRGIAFGAELADLQFVSPVIDNAVPAKAFTWKNENIDIYSCSFARFSDSFTTYPLEFDVRQALKNGTSNGRRQRGSIYVVSSGNGGSSFIPDSCAYQGFMNNVYVILVAGINHQLNSLPTGEKCSAMMVTAPTRTLGYNVLPEMITTEGMNVTGNFGMNSAATAIVSGSIAVTLSANQTLSYRDVMHIISQTANSSLPFKNIAEPFRCNDAGFKVSSQYGFGLIDVEAMVEEAIKWKSVGNKIICQLDPPVINVSLPHFLQNETLFQVEGDCNITYLEHVEVTLIIDAPGIGHSTINMLSPPTNFKSKIIPGRILDNSDLLNITVVSVQFWGQNPYGTWKLETNRKAYVPGYNCTLDKFGVKYRGSVNTTKTGRSCQLWSSRFEYDQFPDDHNYCRNPNNDSRGPWCYTNDAYKVSESCNIPYCGTVQSAKIVFHGLIYPPKRQYKNNCTETIQNNKGI